MLLRPRTSLAIACAVMLLGVIVFALAHGAVTTVTLSADRHGMPDIRGKWSGTVEQFSHDQDGTVPVELVVESISGDEFTGTMEWPAFDGCRTRVQGAFDGDLIKWTETEYLKGDDVVLYGLYVAKFGANDAEMVGDWMDPKHTINPKGPRFGVPGASIVLKKE